MTPNATNLINEANRLSRARQIIAEGYIFSYDADIDTVYVCKPGKLSFEYTIGDQITGRDGCSCPDFQKRGTACKHMLAWELLKEAQEAENAQVAEYEAMMSGAELETTGIDYRL